MTDREFDRLMEKGLSDLPPAPDVANDINPWKRAFTRILWGLALNAVTLNFATLQYILPAIGMILLLLGFRTLRRENGYFRACWVISVILAVVRLFVLATNATIWRSAFSSSLFATLLNYGIFILQPALVLCLRAGLRAVQRKAGLEPSTKPAAALAVWYFLILPLSLLTALGTLFSILMIIAYIIILYCLRKLSKALEEAGYAMEAAPVRLSDGWFKGLCCGLLALLLAVGWIFFRRYPMEWAPVQETTQEAAIADLSQLSIPEHILRDLTDEDLAACMGAEQIVINEQKHGYPNGNRLLFTNIAVKLPETKDTWKFIHHYQWERPPNCRGTEAIQLWTASNINPRSWLDCEGFSGRVMYDRGGVTYAAPYYSLGRETFTTTGIWGTQQSTDPIATFSFPLLGNNYRFYVAYDAKHIVPVPVSAAQSWVNYAHQTAVLQYPVTTARDYLTGNRFHLFSAFEYTQSCVQFYPLEDGSVVPFSGISYTRDTAEK